MNREAATESTGKNEKYNPNGPRTGCLTGDEYFDYIGKFCGQPSRYNKRPIRQICYLEAQMAV